MIGIKTLIRVFLLYTFIALLIFFKCFNKNEIDTSFTTFTYLKNSENPLYEVHDVCQQNVTNYYLSNGSYKTKLDDKVYELEKIELNLKKLSIKINKGGLSFSKDNNNCTSKVNVAIIIPYRDRFDHLKVFLNNMHSILSRQNINYGIYVIEQTNNDLFNRALLMNIGYLESIKESKILNYDCFIFHDVDFLPEDVRNYYECDYSVPLHFAVAVEQYGYNTSGYWGESYYGGVCAFTKSQFEEINGLSNLFFGWGKEDDNMFQRVKLKYKYFKKKPAEIARYHTLNTNHIRVKPEGRFKIFKEADLAMNQDNILEGLSTIKYKLLSVKKYNLFTLIRVTFSRRQIMNEWKKILKSLKQSFK